MEGAREFLEHVRQLQLVMGNFQGLLHLMIGRKIARADNTVLSTGLTWRQLSELLRVLRWDKDYVRELGLNPDELPPRDRQRYWYTAITMAKVDSPEAAAAADRLAQRMAAHGYWISSPAHS